MGNERKPGFYWVKDAEPYWKMAKWVPEGNGFKIFGDSFLCLESEITEIGPYIPMPDEQLATHTNP